MNKVYIGDVSMICDIICKLYYSDCEEERGNYGVYTTEMHVYHIECVLCLDFY